MSVREDVRKTAENSAQVTEKLAQQLDHIEVMATVITITVVCLSAIAAVVLITNIKTGQRNMN